MSYIAKVNINNAAVPTLIGSTLYGICSTSASTAAKTVASPEQDDAGSKFINTHFTTFMQGATIHVKFTQGNTATQNITLAVGTTSAKDVVGMPTCDVNTIISFTYDENEHWVVNDNVDTNTEYVFKTAYDASTNKAATEGDITSAITDLNLGAASQKAVVSDLSTNSNSTDVPTAAAVYTYVQSQTGGLAGLSGAMHFRGTTATQPSGSTIPTDILDYNNGSKSPEAGDVILYGSQEYVWNGSWILLGDEGSYALKSNYKQVTLTPNTLPTLTPSQVSVPNVTAVGSVPTLTKTDVSIPKVIGVGAPTTMEVNNGVLQITIGSAPTLDSTDITATKIDSWDAGSVPTLGTAIEFDAIGTFTQGSQASINIQGDNVVLTASPSP